MKIHEYQAKEILRKFGVTTPRGVACFSVPEATKAAETLGGKVWVVKAQIHAGGRGKGGGVKLAKSVGEVSQLAGPALLPLGDGLEVRLEPVVRDAVGREQGDHRGGEQCG